ncbi:MAG: DUF484 family protein [Alphaproteobacteria bacterium]|nr:DUF484 family protein [Alphaproteobacteria bacterium]
MANEPEPTLLSPVAAATADEVAAYLRAHPDFLVRHPELLAVLMPPAREQGDNVVDMQQFVTERLRRELERLRDSYKSLVTVSRTNLSVQARIHAGVLALLKARSFDHFIDIVTNELAGMVRADVVTLCIEAGNDVLPHAVKAGVYVLQPGAIDEMIGAGREVALHDDVAGDPRLFGPAAGLVRSQALVRLNISRDGPGGVLAIGSRRRNFFSPKQGTELLTFLARTVEHSIRILLDLPPRPSGG